MAVTAYMYGNFLRHGLLKEVNISTDDIKVLLCTSSYVPNQDTHEYKSSITNEVTGTGYTAGGKSLTTKTLTYDNTTNTIKFDADDVVWASSTITARYAVLYDNTPTTDATRPLIGYIDFGADMSSSNGNFTITFDATGILSISTT